MPGTVFEDGQGISNVEHCIPIKHVHFRTKYDELERRNTFKSVKGVISNL